MHFVGVDLAWGERKPTGLAVLDDGGHLVAVSVADTDAAIGAALAPYVAGDCLVAIDAPLVVRNATGPTPASRSSPPSPAGLAWPGRWTSTSTPSPGRPAGRSRSTRTRRRSRCSASAAR